MQQTSLLYDTILILDFGSQYSHLITRRIRELGIYCELFPCTQSLSSLTFTPKGIILSGGPFSVYEKSAPHADPLIWEMNIPVIGICYGLQEIAFKLGGQVQACSHREYGKAVIQLNKHADANHHSHRLFKNIPVDEFTVWMSHGDQISKLPDGFVAIGSTPTAPYVAIANDQQHIYGLQFHPEVTHSQYGKELLRNFAVDICDCATNWTMESFVHNEIERIRMMVGEKSHVIGAVSGGVDSTVASKLMSMAIGERFHGIMVDNGVMRYRECEAASNILREKLCINLKVVDASDLFLGKLKGITDPEKKRKIIGNTFIEVFEAEAHRIESETNGKIEYLLQGTLYPDVIESISFKGPSATIKTHHNVGGLLDDMKLKLIEPLGELFKDEVRQMGLILGIDEELVWRHPFPGPGIAIRVLGEVTPSQVAIVRHADRIYLEELKKNGLYRKIAQAYAALLPIRSVGVMGDKRTYEQVIALRAVETTDFMTADWFEMPYDVLKRISSRIINEVEGVNRVVYDVSSKPPSTIEWE